jgi:cell wall-associated NlpC family hydrolase
MSKDAPRLLAIIAIALLAAGCAGTPSRDPAPIDTGAAAPAEIRRSITELALSMVGVEYRYGGAHPDDGFDCSGLVHYSYTSNGLTVPRTSQAQYEAAREITLEEAQAGDLLFFRDQAKLSHVGIYLGDGEFVHAPSSGKAVSVARVDVPYYQRNLVAVGRLLP